MSVIYKKNLIKQLDYNTIIKKIINESSHSIVAVVRFYNNLKY